MWKKQKKNWQHFILPGIVLLLTVSGKTWNYLPKYYKNITFVGVVNLVYYLLCRRHLVWEFTPTNLDWRILRYTHVCLVTPLLVLSYLSSFPSTLIKQIKHLNTWVIGSSLVEYAAHKQKLIQYKHGWNIRWSGFLYYQMFIYSALFTRRPALTCLLSVCSIIFFVKKFKVPIKSKHPFSRNFGGVVDSFYHTFLEDLL